MNTPNGNTRSAAELTLSLIMALARNIPAAVSSLKSGKWERSKFMGTELSGKTIGIVGLGRIGREVAKWCQAFGMTTIGYDPVMAADVAAKAGITPVTLDELYARSDIISLHTPKTPETTNLICTASLAKCKQGVKIVNVARGGIVNEADLLVALNSGRVGGAALDVYSSEPAPEGLRPLLAHPSVICTPHLGASTNEAQVNVAKDIAVQMADALDGVAFNGVVNASNLSFLSRPDLSPYTSIAERLGALQAQLMTGKLAKVRMSLQGPLVSDPAVAGALRTAVLKGLLTVTQGEGAVNYINTPYLAAQLGIDVVDTLSPKSLNYNNLITVTFETTAGEAKSVSASVFDGGDARLVGVDGFKVDINPRGDMLFFNNSDQPGVLARITSVLAKAGVNIAHFGLGRHAVGGEALGVLTLDGPVPEDSLAAIRELTNVRNVRTARVQAMDVVPSAGKPAGNGGAAAASRTDERAAAGLFVTSAAKPTARPSSASFGSGPTKKRPGWSLSALSDAALGRSHRSKLGKDKLKRALDLTRDLLQLPAGYHVGIVPGSDTGAFECAMWSLLGPKPVDSVHFESFGSGWHSDILKQLKLKEVTEITAPYGVLPDLAKTSPDHDIQFTWNGTTSGVMVPNADWISSSRTGLTLCDATSAVFSQPLEFPKLDVVTYSWQKVLGGEGAHGMMILSPAAVARLESYTPSWPMPKVFRLTKKGKFEAGIFLGDTINTPSMLCVEDYLDSLAWAGSQGGVAGLTARSNANLAVIDEFVKANDWIHFLVKDKAVRSNTSVCLTLDLHKDKVKALTTLLEKEGVAFDIGSYRDAPAGLRIWAGASECGRGTGWGRGGCRPPRPLCFLTLPHPTPSCRVGGHGRVDALDPLGVPAGEGVRL